MAPLRGNPAFLSNVGREVLAEAQRAHREGRLGFLVGAGLSTPIGLPGWSAFNQALVEHTLERHTPGGVGSGRERARAYAAQIGHSLAAVDFCRRRAGSDFHVVLRGALYEHAPLQRFAPTEVHYALCKLAAETRPPFPVLHTTNYDELLELALRTVTNTPVRAVHALSRAWSDGPRVVHLHGYFPHAPLSTAQRQRLARTVVGSDLDFSRLSNDHAAWTNRELLQLLDARSVLIVGMSLTDPNVRRLFAYLSDRRPNDGPQHFVVMQHRRPDGDSPQAAEAARLLDDDEHEFWKARGVKVLRIATWDRLNYLLRRIRFADDKWDRRHQALRVAWARATYGRLDLEEPGLQALGTAALAAARDQLANQAKLDGRVELNLFLPRLDGSYRRALSSMEGRALEAPRPFIPAHDRHTILELEAALQLGQPIHRTIVKGPGPAPSGQPPFQTWYRTVMSVPYFDDAAGGVPVAVVQLCAASQRLVEDLDGARLVALRESMKETVRQVTLLLQDHERRRTI